MARTMGIACLSIAAVTATAAGSAPPRAFADGRNEPAMIELGRRLFFDPAVSRSGTNSCASCHDPEHGWSSRNAHDEDDFTLNPRHTHTLIDNALRIGLLHWDGEYARVEQLMDVRLKVPSAAIPKYQHGAIHLPGFNDIDRPVAVRPVPPPPAKPPPSTTPGAESAAGPASPPPLPPLELPDPEPRTVYESQQQGHVTPPLLGQTPPHIVAFRTDSGRRRSLDLQQLMPIPDRIERDGRYAEAFEAAFGNRSVTISRIGNALGEFTRTIRSGESPYDRYAAGDDEAISASARRGLALFKGAAGCARCHHATGARPAFMDGRYHVTGIVARSYGGKKGIDSDEEVRDVLDEGHARLSTSPDDRRAFRTPSLRDVARHAPWMHDGSMTSLADVVRHYANGAVPDPHLDPLLVEGFDASKQDVEDIVAFLETLTSDFRPGIAPDWSLRAKTTRVRLLDDAGRPLVGLRVRAVPAGDGLPGDVPLTSPELDLVSDEDGVVEFAPPRRTHTRLILPDGLRAPQGELIPDSCRRFDLRIPVVGRASVTVTGIPKQHVLQGMTVHLPALEPESLRAPAGFDTRIPLPPALALNPRRMHFVRRGTTDVGGETVVRYEGWVPASAPLKGLVTFLAGSSRVVRVVGIAPGDETRIDVRD